MGPFTIPSTTMSLPAKSINPSYQQESVQSLADPQTHPKVLRPNPLQSTPSTVISSSSSTHFFRFMDLPVEIRKEIYDCFADSPPRNEPTVPRLDLAMEEKEWLPKIKATRATLKEQRAISITRSSLLTLCRQVNSEWAPMYFRSTDIVVHGPKLEYWGPTPSTTSVEVRIGRELGFEKSFLNIASHKCLGNVRKLRFDASIHRPYDFVDARISTTVNWPALRQFARILHLHHESLPLLQEIEIYARYQERVGINKADVCYCHQRPTAEDVWSLVSEGGNWEQIEVLLVHRKRGAALQGWNIARSVVVHQECPGSIEVVHVQITKPTKAETVSSAASTSSSTTVLQFYKTRQDVRHFHHWYFGAYFFGVDMGRYEDVDQDQLDREWEIS